MQLPLAALSRSACGLVCLLAVSAFAQKPSEIINGHRAVAGEVIVQFRDARGVSAAAPSGVDEVRELGRNLRLLKSRSQSAAHLLDQFRRRNDVEFAEPNYIVRSRAVPNEPSYFALWGLPRIGAPAAWDGTIGSDLLAVGVVDTGVDYTHPDLAANMWTAPVPFTVTIGGRIITCPAGSHGYNALSNSCDPMDDHGHGTHVAGTIGAAGNNALGITGVNWRSKVLALKFLGANGEGSTADAIEAIDFAIQVKQRFAGTATPVDVRVLSNSWGGPGYSESLYQAVLRANAADILFVAAAGNERSNNDYVLDYPGGFNAPNVLSVAATDASDQLASFSNYGATTVHLGAPGVSIYSTYRGGGYAYLSGTSMATPHVSGAAALILSRCNLNPQALRTNLLLNVDIVPGLAGRTTTAGRLNVDRAIRSCVGGTSTAAPLTLSPASVSLQAGQSQRFMASAPVTFSLSPAVGSVAADGTYTAPALIAAPQIVVVTATGAFGTATATVQLIPPATVSLTPSSALVECNAGSGSFNISVAAGAAWSATSLSPWLAVSVPSGAGPSPVIYSYGSNACGALTGSPRTGTLTVNGQPFSVKQLRTARLFADVQKESQYFDAVNVMYSRNITKGCSLTPLSYCPDAFLTREQMAVFLVRAWSLKIFGSTEAFQTAAPPPVTPYFRDVPRWLNNDPNTPNPAYPYLQKLRELGLTSGCRADAAGLDYCPDSQLTNLEIAIFSVRTRQLIDGNCLTNCVNNDFTNYTRTPYFSDEPQPPVSLGVNPTRDFAFIQKAVDLKAISPSGSTPGCGVGRFCRYLPMTRAVKAMYVMKAILNEPVE